MLLAALLATPERAIAQNIIATVNGEPVTGEDIRQALLWEGRDSCIERMKVLFTGKATVHKDREVWTGPRPAQTQEEAQQAAERIKKQVIAEAIEEAIGNKLRLQATKKLGIEISGAQVEETLVVCAAPGPDGKPDMNAVYKDLARTRVKPEQIRKIVSVQLAWRQVIRHISGAGDGPAADPRDSTYESFSRSYLQELRQKASIEYRGPWKQNTTQTHR